MKKITNLIFLAFILFTNSSFSEFKKDGFNPGDPAKDFNLKNIDGKLISLKDYKNEKGVIVIFTCNNCPYAQAYEQRIIELHKKYAVLGYPVVAINSNDPVREPEDSYENMQKRAIEKAYPFVYLFDETQDVAKNYGATRTPHVFLLKKEKKRFILVYSGAIDDNYEDANAVKTSYLTQAIKELETNKPVSIPGTKAIGCGIKWKKN
ncbi:MAG: thioredoxin family protein [Bacteroidia bacterium]|jgi:peroxiredoxin